MFDDVLLCAVKAAVERQVCVQRCSVGQLVVDSVCVCVWWIGSPLTLLLSVCLCRKFGERPQPQRLTR